MGEDNNEIRKLIDELNYYTKLYDEGKPEISDKEWDDKYFLLQKMEQKTGIYYEDSPTQRVNYQVVNKLNKVEHSHPMLSLDKTKSIDEVKSFLGNKPHIAMAKMDGLTCSLTYENGRLVAAETRGNGIIGEDILHNALQIKSIPKRIEYTNKLVVDGEVICTYEDFENFKDEYKNPRNFASGSIRLLNSEESANRHLTFIAWDVIEGFKDNDFLSTRLKELGELGFTYVPFFYDNSIEDNRVEHAIDEIKIFCNKIGYPIDGIVFKYDKVSEYLAAGRTDHHFKGGIAYKFYDDEYETKLIDIEWTMGRTGQLTPVAVYEDIDIDGTICNRASLHNITILKDTLGGYGWDGQKIKVFKANQIIPQISWAQPEDEYAKKYFHYPMTCPICNQPTKIKKDVVSEVLYCDNPGCEGKLLNKFDHFCSKKGLDIKGLSKATLEKLMDWGWLNTYQDLFILNQHRDQWIKKAGFGIASVDKILNAIEEGKNTTLDKVIAAAGIPEIGTKVAKDLAKHYNTWGEFRAETNFLQYDGIGEVMAENLLNFDYDNLNLDYTVNLHLKIAQQEKQNEQQNLEGKVFCITGKVHIFKNRAELQADIESKGGKVVSSMSNKVTHLINNDNTSTSSKNLAAQKANIPIITEEEYLELCNN